MSQKGSMRLMLSLVALVVLATFSLASGYTDANPIRAATQGPNAQVAIPGSDESASLDSEGFEADSDSSACWPSRTACSIYNDQCCTVCQPLVGTAGRCF